MGENITIYTVGAGAEQRPSGSIGVSVEPAFVVNRGILFSPINIISGTNDAIDFVFAGVTSTAYIDPGWYDTGSIDVAVQFGLRRDSVEIKSGINDNLTYTLVSFTRSVTIPSGFYDAEGIRVAVSSAMTADFDNYWVMSYLSGNIMRIRGQGGFAPKPSLNAAQAWTTLGFSPTDVMVESTSSTGINYTGWLFPWSVASDKYGVMTITNTGSFSFKFGTGVHLTTSAGPALGFPARDTVDALSVVSQIFPVSVEYYDCLDAPYSSTFHEISRLNAVRSGTDYYESTGSFDSMSGRGSVTLEKPRGGSDLFYSKTSLVSISGGQDPRFVRLIYAVTASADAGDVWVGSADPGAGVTASVFGSNIDPTGTDEYREVDGYVVGRYVAKNPWDPYVIRFPVSEYGKIRDIKVWLELTHDNRSTGRGLDGLVVALKSPNIQFNAANPLLDSNETRPLVANPNPSLTGTNGIIFAEKGALDGIETIRRGTYLLWDGHLANASLAYLSSSLAAGIDSYEFGTDMDMRVVFTDSSRNLNPASRLVMHPSATTNDPGAASDISATLIGLPPNYQPLERYYAPNNYAKRTYPSSVANVSVSGNRVPWVYPSELARIEDEGTIYVYSSGGFDGRAIGYPPDGWNTGEQNAGFTGSWRYLPTSWYDSVLAVRNIVADIDTDIKDSDGNPTLFLVGGMGPLYADGVYQIVGVNFAERKYGPIIRAQNNTLFAFGQGDSVSWDRGVFATSSNWYSWSTPSVIGTNNLNIHPYGACSYPLLVVVGATASGGVYTSKAAWSADYGASWTTATIGSTSDGIRYRSVSYKLPVGPYVAVGNSGRIATSSNLTSWSGSTVGSVLWKHSIYSNVLNQIVAVGGAKVLADYFSGVTVPATYTLPGSFDALTVVESGSYIVVLGFDGTSGTFAVASASNLNSWVTGNIALNFQPHEAVVMDDGKIVVVGEDYNTSAGMVVYAETCSPFQSSTWFPVAVGGYEWRSVVKSGSYAVALGTSDYLGSSIARSLNGASWESENLMFPQTLFRRYGVEEDGVGGIDIYRYSQSGENGSMTGTIDASQLPRTSGTGFFPVNVTPHSTSFYIIVGGGHSSSLVIGRSSASAGVLQNINWDTNWRTGTDFGGDDRTQGIARCAAYTSVYTTDESKCIIYSFGGQEGDDGRNLVQLFSASATSGAPLTMSLSKWKSIDESSNLQNNSDTPTWTYSTHTTGAMSVAISGARYVLAINSNRNAYSDNGTTWTEATQGGTYQPGMNSVIWDSTVGRFFKAGFFFQGSSPYLGGYMVMSSSDGATWSFTSFPITGQGGWNRQLFDICRVDTGRFAAVGWDFTNGRSAFATSSDSGATWGLATVSCSLSSSEIMSPGSGPALILGLDIASGLSKWAYTATTNPPSWTTGTLSGTAKMCGFHSASKYYAFSRYAVFSSSNGTTWGSSSLYADPGGDCTGAAYDGGLIALCFNNASSEQGCVLISTNAGSSWTKISPDDASFNPMTAAVSGSTVMLKNDKVGYGNPGSTAFRTFAGNAYITPLTIPESSFDAAACVNVSRSVVYYSGGQVIRDVRTGTFVDNHISSDRIYGIAYEPTTGLLTGTFFNAGRLPVPLSNHRMFVYNNIVYVVGGATFSYLSGGAVQVIANDKVYSSFVGPDDSLSSWSVVSQLPGSKADLTGSGMIGGGSLIFSTGSGDFVLVLAGARGSTMISDGDSIFPSGQSEYAQIKYVGAGVARIAATRAGDGIWMGPAEGELQTYGEQFGPTDIRPVFPLLDDVEESLVRSTLDPSRWYTDLTRKYVGLRPGLKGSEINGTWELQLAVRSDFDPLAGFKAAPDAAVWVRQARIEFVIDKSPHGQLQSFNPARRFMYEKPSTSTVTGRRLVDIISGSCFWDAGVHYVYSRDRNDYGRRAGITSDMNDVDSAVSVNITGALWDYLSGSVSGTPSWFLNPPPGDGMPGIPFIPVSSASHGEASMPPGPTGSYESMMRATVDPRLPVPVDDTLPAYLSRVGAVRTTMELYERELQSTGSDSSA